VGYFMRPHKSYDEWLLEEEKTDFKKWLLKEEEEFKKFVKLNYPQTTCEDCEEYILDPCTKTKVCKHGYAYKIEHCPLWNPIC